MESPNIDLKNVAVQLAGQPLLHPLDWTLKPGEQWLLTGASGSGKTTLAKVFTGSVFHSGTASFPAGSRVHYIPQQHHFKNRSHTSDFYYQQRFQSQDAEDSLTIEEELATQLEAEPIKTREYLTLLHLEGMVQKPILQLSNGENKRLQLVKALLLEPTLLILDAPFTGLDVDGRKLLHSILKQLSESGIQLIVIGTIDELPECITHIAFLEGGRLAFNGQKADYFLKHETKATLNTLPTSLLAHLKKYNGPAFENAVELRNVQIEYGGNRILDGINLIIQRGEKCCLSGPNGAGKSTLLSLITADNPQAYANEIHLFDKKRGSGESIWDIKKKLGYVSPELHLFFPLVSTCLEVIGSGLFDTVGLFRRLSDEQEEQVNEWLRILHLEKVAHIPLHQLSLGQRQMALLGRALIKNPPLLVLDEPCQGLDHDQTLFFNGLVDQICEHNDTTLLYVSHYAAQIPSCINRLIKIEAGRLLDV